MIVLFYILFWEYFLKLFYSIYRINHISILAACDRVLIILFIFGIKSMYFSFKLSSSLWENTAPSTESIFAYISRLRIKPRIHNSACY